MTESLLCNSCGAPLEVPESAQFIKCNHCNTQLAIRRDATITFTEAIERLTKSTESLEKKVEQLSSRQAVAELDAAWKREQEEYYISGENGSKQLPTEAGAIVGGIFAVVFGLFWIVMTSSFASSSFHDGPRMLPFAGVVIIFIGVAGAVYAHTKAAGYKNAEARYRRRRRQLQDKH